MEYDEEEEIMDFLSFMSNLSGEKPDWSKIADFLEHDVLRVLTDAQNRKKELETQKTERLRHEAAQKLAEEKKIREWPGFGVF